MHQLMTGTIRFPDLKNIDLDTKIVITSALVQKLWSKTNFAKWWHIITKPRKVQYTYHNYTL